MASTVPPAGPVAPSLELSSAAKGGGALVVAVVPLGARSDRKISCRRLRTAHEQGGRLPPWRQAQRPQGAMGEGLKPEGIRLGTRPDAQHQKSVAGNDAIHPS